LRYGPLALWVLCCGDKDTEVWVTPIDIISLVVLVISYGWSPHTVAVLGYGIAVIGWERLDSMIYNLPVHQVFGMKYGQTGDMVETGGGEIEILSAGSYAHIGVGIVCVNDRIGEGSVTIVW